MRTTEHATPSPSPPSRGRAARSALVVLALVAVGGGLPSLDGCALEVIPGGGTEFDGAAPAEVIPTGSAVLDASGPMDAALPKVPSRGSPLCRATKETCWPDEGALQCGGSPAPPDSGTGDAGAPQVFGDACHVTLSGPSCASAGSGKDGSTCTASSDCSAGSDCVLRADGLGQCRRYCCGGTCTNVGSPSGGATFCDVVQLAEESKVKVPVCMPVKACKLLTAGQCEAGETCSVAAEDGTTSCVRTGPAQADAPCDETHCAAGLTCLGKPGARRCFQLCRVGAAPCAKGMCKTSSLIRDTSFGLCL